MSDYMLRPECGSQHPMPEIDSFREWADDHVCSCGEWLDGSGACPIRLYPTCRTPLDAVNERAEKPG